MAGAKCIAGYNVLVLTFASSLGEIREQAGLHRRHCEEPRAKREGATKQSSDAIFQLISAKIVLKDCFVALHTKA